VTDFPGTGDPGTGQEVPDARTPASTSEDPDDRGIPPETDRDTTVIARTVARIVLPLILLTALALLFQGHNRPGGGFIAGVLTAAGIGLVYVVYGLDYLESELLHRPPPAPVPGGGFSREYGSAFGLGLAIAVGAGLGAIALGYPFLTQAVVFLEDLPVYDTLEVASAFAFDLGVYVTVVGALLTILAVVGAE
jgi:multicomponent Na+:H+ antiporter subunit B